MFTKELQSCIEKMYLYSNNYKKMRSYLIIVTSLYRWSKPWPWHNWLKLINELTHVNPLAKLFQALMEALTNYNSSRRYLQSLFLSEALSVYAHFMSLTTLLTRNDTNITWQKCGHFGGREYFHFNMCPRFCYRGWRSDLKTQTEHRSATYICWPAKELN